MELYALIMIASLLVGFGDSLFSFFSRGSAGGDTDDNPDIDDGNQPPEDRRIFDDSDGSDDGTITGTNGDDEISGSTAAQGFDGDDLTSPDDTITALSGDDSIFAGLGNDQIFGGNGNDVVLAGFGADEVKGVIPFTVRRAMTTLMAAMALTAFGAVKEKTPSPAGRALTIFMAARAVT